MKLREFWIILTGTLISMWVSLWNRFPLVFTDTGTYIHSGFSGNVPADRPIFYGLFIRYVSLGSSLYLVILAQAFMLSWLILLTLKMFLKGFQLHAVFLASILGISLFTAYSFTVSILIPDIFSAIGFLAFLNLVFNQNLSKWNKVVLALMLVLSIAMHFSNLPILLLLFGLLFIARSISKDSSWLTADRSKIIVASLIGSLVLIPSVNYVYSGSFFLSRGSHIFMFSHLAECGVMERYLKEQCQEENLNLCAYKDDFKDGFLWRSEGAFKDLGRFDGNVEEYKRVNRTILTSPKYWPLLAQKAIEYTAKQLVTFEAKVDVPQGKGSAPYSQIEWRYRDALYEYGYSKQNQGSLSTKFVNAIQPIIILASAILLLLALLYSDRFLADDHRLKKVIITVLLFMLVNAMACSNLSTVHPRYQSRIAWIMPIMASVVVLRFKHTEQ